MKRFLLMFCALPLLATAQAPTDRTESLPYGWLKKNSAFKNLELRSNVTDDLPDTTYYYLDSKQGSRLYKYYWTEYDEQGNVILEQGFMDNSFPYKADTEYKSEHSYYQQGDTTVEEIITSKILNKDGVWKIYSKTVYYLNSKGDPIELFTYYPLETGGWELNRHEKYDITYSQNRVSEYYGLKQNQSGTWGRFVYVTVEYPASDAMLTTYYYPNQSGQWLIEYDVESIFDSHGNVIIETTTYYDNGTQYTDTYKYIYLSDIVTNSVTVTGISSTVYPNPAVDKVTVSLNNADNATVTIYDFAGKAVLQKAIGSKEIIDVSSLSKGVYVLTVKTSASTDVHKLIVK
ncbi:MAG: T9SS type A sorting domain-containing protein [Tannerella sp.]|nr:T9SS type A sorting domain-containing protein [Tannerella sp.]